MMDSALISKQKKLSSFWVLFKCVIHFIHFCFHQVFGNFSNYNIYNSIYLYLTVSEIIYLGPLKIMITREIHYLDRVIVSYVLCWLLLLKRLYNWARSTLMKVKYVYVFGSLWPISAGIAKAIF